MLLKDIVSYHDFFYKQAPGVRAPTITKFIKRFEYNVPLNCYQIVDLEDFDLFFLDFFFKIFPKNLSIFDRQAASIVISSIVWSYKSWRHFKGLPCRGQRTWSNASSCYRSNLILRDYKKKNVRKIYGKYGGPEQKICFLCEYINYLWKSQWFSEWMHSRKWIKYTLKKKRVVFYLDLYATSKGLLGNLKRDAKGVTKKKKKMLTGHVGFDQGFTKIYLKAKYAVSKKVRKKLSLRDRN